MADEPTRVVSRVSVRTDKVDIEQAEKSGLSPANGHEHVEGNALLVDKRGEIRLLPVPSDDPNDPLNFTRWEKLGLIVCCSLLSLGVSGGLGAIIGTFFAMYEPQGYTTEQITYLITVPSLAIGLGNFIILPLALAVGRRPVFIGSSLVLLATTIAAALQNSYNGHLAARIVQGLATGASESLLPLMLTEVTFLHQRSLVFGLYWMIQSIFSNVLNIVSSYIVSSLGWRWYYWVFAITIGVGFLLVLFLGFETRYSRPATSIDGTIVFTDEFGVTHVLGDDEAQEYLEQQRALGNTQLPRVAGEDSADDYEERKSYLQKIKPWSTPHPQPLKMIGLAWLRMVQCLTSPAIIYAILTSSITLGIVVDQSLTYGAVLEGYGWAAKSLGLVNLGGIVGPIIAALYSALIGDRFVLWLAKRNHGIHKPEHRLLVLVPPALYGFAVIFVYGWTAQGAGTWWGTIVSYTAFSSTFVVVLIVSSSFAAEACAKHPGPALVIVVGSKNIISFGFTNTLTPLMNHGGYTYAFGVLAGIFGAVFVLGIPIYFFNPVWRRYIARMEKRWGVETTD
ncbi:hypothetical protein SEUCBS140593_000881 [Sporothrix eucalyptigena]|uniref:Major facilitator superfamily (MFS) profile domain-containing protein n=1 Tax=Sporothrix eucalyptigena TaxID=1812306 RepID=A0ABP0ATM1_9PEZI